jgi:signal transduction histidine kinase
LSQLTLVETRHQPLPLFRSPTPLAVENEIALHLYYIVLEALANASKQSGGANMDIILQPSGDRWLLTIQGDGIGFSLPARSHEGMGLRILQYRARVIGAALNLHSQLGSGTKGTCLFCRFRANCRAAVVLVPAGKNQAGWKALRYEKTFTRKEPHPYR